MPSSFRAASVSQPPTYRLGPYREYAPQRDLAAIVEVAWSHTPADALASAVPPHRVLPENAVSIALRCVRRPDGRLAHGELLVIGPVYRARLYAPAMTERLEAIRLRPEWCRSLLDLDPREHADCLTPLRDIDRRRAGGWLDVLRRTSRPERALLALADLVRVRLAAARQDRSTRLAHAALEQVRTGERSQRAIAHAMAVSDRHVRRVVRESIGMAPARFARVHRLNATMRIADGLQRPNWARLAAASGFFDQSHLIATCRALTGRSAVELHRERRRQTQLA